MTTFTDIRVEVPPTSMQLLRATGTGFGVLVVPGTDIAPLNLRAQGAYPYEPSVALTLPAMPSGMTVSGMVEYRHKFEKVEIRNLRVELSNGPTRYEFDLPVRELGDAPLPSPSLLSAVNPVSGQTSSDADVTIVGADAGGMSLVRSSSTQIDPLTLPSLPNLQHLFATHVMVDVASGTLEPGNGSAFAATTDYAGRFVAFVSEATNLDPAVADLNATRDVFVRDLMLGTTKTVSLGFGPVGFQTANGQSRSPRVSADGRFVVFESKATDMVPGLLDTNNDFDVFRYEIATGHVECLSLNIAGISTADKGAFSSTVSADGQTVSWLTEATDINPSSTTGMQLVTKVASTCHYMKIKIDSSARITLSDDGGTILFWTVEDVSGLVGVPDNNGTFDLLAIHHETNVVLPLSMNGSKTAMGNGSTPAFLVSNDTPDISFDGLRVAFTSSADDLLPGAVIPTTGGVFLSTRPPGSTTWTTDRLDTRPGGGFGTGNSQVTLAADDMVRIAWVSRTNYQTDSPATYPADQIWAYWKCEVTVSEIQLASATLLAGNPVFEPGAGASSTPIYSSAGVLFQTGAVIADLDADGLVDVITSRLDRALTWVTPTGNGTDKIFVSRAGNLLTLEDKLTGLVVNSHETPGIDDIYIFGSNNEADSVTIDFGTGLTSVSNIFLDGGSGSGNDVNLIADRKALMNWYQDRIVETADDAVEVVAVRYHDWRWLSSTGKSTPYILNLAAPGGGGLYDVVVSVASVGTDMVITRDPGTPNQRKVTKVDSFSIKQSIRIDSSQTSVDAKIDLPAGALGAGSTIEFTGSQGNDLVDCSKCTYALTVDGGAGNDAIIGGSASDTITGGSGKNTIAIGGLGSNSDNLIIVAGSSDTITSNDVNDAIDFSTFSSGGIAFNSSVTTPQLIAPSGERLLLASPFGKTVATDFSDAIQCRTFVLPHVLEKSGRLAASSGDTLTFDAQGLPATDLGGRIVTPGYSDVKYTEFEHVTIVNAAPPQVVMTVVNDGAVQRSMVSKLVLSFNFAPMFVGNPADAFTVETKVGGVLQPIDVSLSTINGFTHVTIMPSGTTTFSDGRYILRAGAAQIVGGLTGGDYSFAFHRLFGDADGNAAVTAGDFNAFRLVYGTTGPSYFDIDGDNAVTASDFNAFRTRYGVVLAP